MYHRAPKYQKGGAHVLAARARVSWVSWQTTEGVCSPLTSSILTITNSDKHNITDVDAQIVITRSGANTVPISPPRDGATLRSNMLC
jgi:hypothetical protein